MSDFEPIGQALSRIIEQSVPKMGCIGVVWYDPPREYWTRKRETNVLIRFGEHVFIIPALDQGVAGLMVMELRARGFDARKF